MKSTPVSEPVTIPTSATQIKSDTSVSRVTTQSPATRGMNVFREIQSFWQRHLGDVKTARVPDPLVDTSLAKPASVANTILDKGASKPETIGAARSAPQPTHQAASPAEPKIAPILSPAQKIDTAKAQVANRRIDAAQPQSEVKPVATIARPDSIKKPESPRPNQASTVSETNTQPKSPIAQSERLGGTEAIPRKDEQLKTDKINADTPPRSFWGVKVTKESQPKPLEELPRVTIPNATTPRPDSTRERVARVASKPMQVDARPKVPEAGLRTVTSAAKSPDVMMSMQPDRPQVGKETPAILADANREAVRDGQTANRASASSRDEKVKPAETPVRHEVSPARPNVNGSESVLLKSEKLSSGRIPRPDLGAKVTKETHPNPLDERPQSATPDVRAVPSEVTADRAIRSAPRVIQPDVEINRPEAAPTPESPLPRKPVIIGAAKPESVRNPELTIAPATQSKHATATVEPAGDTNTKFDRQNHAPVHTAEAQFARETAPEKPDAKAFQPIPATHSPARNERPADAPSTVTEQNAVSSPAMTQASNDLSSAPMTTTLPSRALFTLEQIKELQAMVSKSLQGARVTVDGGKEAVFSWNHEALGPLSFRVTTRNDDVEIRIQSGRQDVAKALEEGRGTIERMIADLGMKIERFEVKVRPEAATQDLANQTHEREHPDDGRRPEPESGTGIGQTPDIDTEPEAVRSPRSFAEREWVA